MKITPERAATMLLALDDIWRYARELDHVDPEPVPVLRWLRRYDLADYRPPNREEMHPVGEWAASDAGLALGDSYRNGESEREDVVAALARIAAGEDRDLTPTHSKESQPHEHELGIRLPEPQPASGIRPLDQRQFHHRRPRPY